MVDLDAYRRESRESWGQMASGWESRREWLMAVTERASTWLVEKLDPRPGQTILDLAAGPGDLGFQIAERVGDEGRVISEAGARRVAGRLARVRPRSRPSKGRGSRFGTSRPSTEHPSST